MSSARASGGAKVLYLSYDGMTDPLGRSQVLPYLTGLAELGHRITLVSLEKPALFALHAATVSEICRETGIDWHAHPYRRRPPIVSALLNVRTLRRAARKLHLAHHFDFTHCRSDLAGLAGLALKQRHRLPLLYDMRAFWPDERAEGGAWDQRKWLYRSIFRYFKARQRDLLNGADEIVALSDAGRRALLEMPGSDAFAPVTVIPCCADFSHFTLPKPAERRQRRMELGISETDRLLIHLGTIGCNCLLDEMLDLFVVYRRRHPTARLLFLTPEDDGTIIASAAARGVADQVVVRSATREEVARWISAADVGLFFVRPVYSKKAASPTKLGEMLAVGLPVITNSGVGDVATIVEDVGAGVVINRFDDAAYNKAVEQLAALDVDPSQIRAKALPWFDVHIGIDRYDALYRRLGAGPDLD